MQAFKAGTAWNLPTPDRGNLPTPPPFFGAGFLNLPGYSEGGAMY